MDVELGLISSFVIIKLEEIPFPFLFFVVAAWEGSSGQTGKMGNISSRTRLIFIGKLQELKFYFPSKEKGILKMFSPKRKKKKIRN